MVSDLLKQLEEQNAHWVGNLNVFIGDFPVERHLAQAVRIYPGTTNVAWFFVGDRPDAFAFDVEAPAHWTVALHREADADPVEYEDWIAQQRGAECYSLIMEVPENADRGSVNVHVKRRSTGQATIVEFTLDACAAGAGCYYAS